MSDTEHVPVLVVGGSLVGLTAGAFLAWFGIPCTVVERHPGTHPHQRATGYYPRTMELLRLLGAETALRELTGAEAERRLRVRMETLRGPVLSRFDLPPPQDITALTPSRTMITDQSRVERALRGRAEALGVKTQFSTRLIEIDQDEGEVRATLQDLRTGRTYVVTADHLVAADGAQSQVRNGLGIGVHGPGVLVRQVSIYFRANLESPVDPRQLVVCQIENKWLRAFFGYDCEGVGMLIVPHEESEPDKLTPERCVDLIRAAAGDPALDVELIGQTPWAMQGQIADRLRDGRVFLTGDAAHVVPPVGGYGANTGMHAAHNLAWKLAEVLAGRADPALLATYEQERLPIARYVLDQSLAQFANRTGGTVPKPIVIDDELTVALGYRYRHGALCPERADGPIAEHPRDLSGEPGTRAPHLWTGPPGHRRPLLDLLGPRFTLLLGADGEPWVDAAEALELPLTVRRFDTDSELAAPEPHWTRAFGVGENGAVLVRPDGFVAWRSTTLPESPFTALGSAAAALYLRPVPRPHTEHEARRPS